MNELKVLVLDLETLKNPDEVGGWGNSWKMGISILVAQPLIVDINGIHKADNPYNIYTDPVRPQRDAIITDCLNWADVIVSHNGLSFDYKVLAGSLSLSWDWVKVNLFPKTIDFLHQIKIRHNVRISLQNVATRTLGEKRVKDLPGDKVVEYWRSGDPVRRQQVIQHCIDDVEWTSEIFCEMYKRTEWAKGVPTGRITFYNPYEAEARKNGTEAERRITGNCVISYPKRMQEFLIELKQVTKSSSPAGEISSPADEVGEDNK